MGSKYSAKDFIKAIPNTGGVISTIAKKVGCTWDTAKRWIETSPTVKKVYDNEVAVVGDMALSNVIKKIEDGHLGASFWYLSKKVEGFEDKSKIDHGGSIETHSVPEMVGALQEADKQLERKRKK